MGKGLTNNLERWGGFIAQRPKTIIAVMLALAALALPSALHILKHLDANIFNQVSEALPRFRTMREVSEDFAGDLLVCVLSISERDAKVPEKAAELKAFGDLLCAELAIVGSETETAALRQDYELDAPGPWLRQVECQMGQDLRGALLELARQHPGAILRSEDVDEIRARFEPDALRERLKAFAVERRETDPQGLQFRALMADPLKLGLIVEQALKRRMSRDSLFAGQDGNDGYFLSSDRTTLLVLARPVRSANEIGFTVSLMQACQAAENRAIEKFRARQPLLSTSLKSGAFTNFTPGESAAPGLAVGFTGIHAISAENEASLRYDVISNTLTAGLFVLVIYLVVYRRVRLAFYIILTLGLAALFTLALTRLIHGPIGVLGAGFTAILIGMGEDYAVYLHNTFHGLRDAGDTPEDALKKTMARCGPSILAAAATAGVAFFSITFTHFRGMAELGLLAGMGLTISGILMLSLFPALLLSSKGSKDSEVAGFVASWIGFIARIQGSRRGMYASLLCGVLVLLMAGALLALGPDPGLTLSAWAGKAQPARDGHVADDAVLGVKFDGDFGNLRSISIKAIPLRDQVARKFGQALTEIKVLSEGSSEDAAFAAAVEVQEKARGYLQRGELNVSGGCLDYLAPPGMQAAALQALHRMDGVELRARFLEVARSMFPNAKVEEIFGEFLGNLDRMCAQARDARPLALKELLASPAGQVLKLYASHGEAGAGQRIRLISCFLPSTLNAPNGWHTELATKLEEAPPAGTRIRVTSGRLVGMELKDSVFLDMFWITMLVAVAVALLLVLTYRSGTKAALASIPLVFGYLFLLSGVQIAQLLGLDFALNFVNLMIFPLLLGTGIDYGIYMVSDAYSERNPKVTELLSQTGLSVFVAALTTLAGFGSMIFSRYTGLVSFGWAALLGYAGALFGALVVFPAVLQLLKNTAACRET